MVSGGMDLAPCVVELEADSAPSGSEQAVSVRVRTQFGDIDVRRAP